jgi:hypothetical protein
MYVCVCVDACALHGRILHDFPAAPCQCREVAERSRSVNPSDGFCVRAKNTTGKQKHTSGADAPAALVSGSRSVVPLLVGAIVRCNDNDTDNLMSLKGQQ